MPSWKNLNEAFRYLRDHIDRKSTVKKFELSAIDLALVSNFKGGNASITEPIETLPRKLISYSDQLKRIDSFINGRNLRQLCGAERVELGHLARMFAKLTDKDAETYIIGFRASYASALLAAYFPDVLPVLDRLVLSETNIVHEDQVKDIESYYPRLIEAFHNGLIHNPELSMRDLDRKWFENNQRHRIANRKSKKLEL